MPSLPVEGLADSSMILPNTTAASFWLSGSAWPFPDYENADVFMRKLAREGLLVLDPVVDSALQGRAQELSPRSVQRRVLRATGLTQATIQQIERAETAVALLEQGTSIAEVVRLAGFADQAHLTRALKRFIGQTPGEIVRAR